MEAVRASGTRVEELLAGFDRPQAPSASRARAEDLVRELVGLYGNGIEHILDAVAESAQERAGDVFARLCDDPLVSGLLAIHGLHPLSPRERVERALAGVRPYIESHQGHVEIVDVDGPLVTLRMEGSCHGCPSSAITLKLAIERAILDACPDVAEVRAEGIESDGHGVSSLSVVSDWLDARHLDGLLSAGITTLEVSGMAVLLVRHDDAYYAYRNRCPACTRDFDAAQRDANVLSCAACGGSFDIVRAGRSLDGGGALEAYPLEVDAHRLRLSMPLPA